MSGKHERKMKILPDPRVKVLEWDVDGTPASIRVWMGDGTTRDFDQRYPQPNVLKALETVRRMKDAIAIGGYKYKPQEEEEHG